MEHFLSVMYSILFLLGSAYLIIRLGLNYLDGNGFTLRSVPFTPEWQKEYNRDTYKFLRDIVKNEKLQNDILKFQAQELLREYWDID